MNAADVAAVQVDVTNQVNTFMASLTPATILALEFRGFPAGKYNRYYSYSGYVTYLATI